ncbi:MAG TPA: BON domain-containing protein [Vicinamibacterales bacterium]|nr:BON domain-containing protein [Vicinamibacterales bacterium]
MENHTATVAERSDCQLQEDVLKALEVNLLDRASIGVTVSHGVVTLSGRVESRGEAWRAEQAVYATAGVLGIANNLQVDEGPTDDDSGIAEAAVDALTRYRGALGGVKVIASNGYITLAGVVPDIHLRGAAERSVRHLRGVRGVWNALRVEQQEALCHLS